MNTDDRERLLARFWAKVKKTETCWLWTGATVDGYGRFVGVGPSVAAHRIAYELLIGAIPPGAVLDHVAARGCVSRACVNPAHLEPVTIAENVRRGKAGRFNAAKTHCPHGHAYPVGEGAIVKGRRRCRECDNARALAYAATHRVERLAYGKRRREAMRVEMRDAARRYRAENREHYLATMRAYRARKRAERSGDTQASD